jgi:nicotinate phosphoribosyltransferase
MLDEAGLNYMKIVVSNQLDEYVIKSLKEQQAPIDIFGIGTRLATGQPDAALDGVYKLSMVANKPRLKLSESLEKITLPGIKQVMRIIGKNEMFYGADVVALSEEEKGTTRMFHPFDPEKSLDLESFQQQPLLQKIMSKGKKLISEPTLNEVADYVQKRLALLPKEYKRFENPHIYKVGISRKLMKLRDDLRHEYKTVGE